MNESLTQEEIKALKELIKDKVEPNERYFKVINKDGYHYSFCEKNKIYKGSLKIRKLDVNYYVSCFPKDWQEVTKEEYDQQQAEEIKKDSANERTPIFTFEGHEYFEGDKAYWFIKTTYKIHSGDCQCITYEETVNTSKIYPSEDLCKEGLYDWIWENHKISGKEYKEIHKIWQKREDGSIALWKSFYCEKIIKQQQA